MSDRRYHETAVRTLRHLTSKGVQLDVRAGRLHYRIPRSQPVEDVLAEIRSVKDHLVELLAEPETYRKATPAEQCARCRGLEARGVSVLLCFVCDRGVKPAQ